MESDRFDDMTRRLATGGTTRRRLLRIVGGAMAGAVLAGFGVRPAVAKQGGGPQGNNGPKGQPGPEGQPGPNGPLGNVGTCDDCNFGCTNCNWTCCGMVKDPGPNPPHRQ